MSNGYTFVENDTKSKEGYCPSCEWRGDISNCMQQLEQESYEESPYLVAFCPRCNCDEVQSI